MPRLLIAGSAVGELRRVEPADRRRRLIGDLSTLDAAPAHRFCAPERFRRTVRGVRVLFRRRVDGTLVILGLG